MWRSDSLYHAQLYFYAAFVVDRYDPEETGSISTDKLRVMCYDYGYYLDEVQFQVPILARCLQSWLQLNFCQTRFFS